MDYYPAVMLVVVGAIAAASVSKMDWKVEAVPVSRLVTTKANRDRPSISLAIWRALAASFMLYVHYLTLADPTGLKLKSDRGVKFHVTGYYKYATFTVSLAVLRLFIASHQSSYGPGPFRQYTRFWAYSLA